MNLVEIIRCLIIMFLKACPNAEYNDYFGGYLDIQSQCLLTALLDSA